MICHIKYSQNFIMGEYIRYKWTGFIWQTFGNKAFYPQCRHIFQKHDDVRALTVNGFGIIDISKRINPIFKNFFRDVFCINSNTVQIFIEHIEYISDTTEILMCKGTFYKELIHIWSQRTQKFSINHNQKTSLLLVYRKFHL